MKYTILLLLLSCKPDLLTPACKGPCLPSADFKAIGQCSTGTWECEDDGGVQCVGWTGPTAEVCDGVDNNCNGVVDENLTQDCSNACGKGEATCSSGKWANCTAPIVGTEICNGKDDDCDGIIDNPDKMPIALCYTGPANTVQYGTCRPGVTKCLGGATVCSGEVVPQTETCNGIDDDCDGTVDNGLWGSPTDLVVILDVSPSMGIYLANINSGLTQFATRNYSRNDVSWALLTAPDHYLVFGSNVIMRENLGDAGTFLTAFSAQMDQNYGSGSEPTMDAVWDTCDSSNPLGLHWTPGNRRLVVVFSDEEAQTYLPTPVTLTGTAAMCNTTYTKVWVFTNLGAPLSVTTWNQIAQPVGTTLKNLSSQSLKDDLETLLSQITCTK